MAANELKVLVALDRSAQAGLVARYVAGLLDPARSEVVLMHVLRASPWRGWALRQEAFGDELQAGLAAWEKKEREEAEAALQAAHAVFLAAGFAPGQVERKVCEPGDGAAAQVRAEARKDYSALALGRRGASPVKDLVLGTTALKLLGRLSEVPLWVVGETTPHPPRRVLLALDDSPESLSAASHLGEVLGSGLDEVVLFHAIESTESFRAAVGNFFPPEFEDQWVARAEESMNQVMDQAAERLVAAGVAPARISRRFARRSVSRAGSIVAAAETGGLGTIVVGRRGLGAVEGLLLGRVSNRLLHMARASTVWVVS